MDFNAEEELRKELEATKRRLYEEQLAREAEKSKAESKAYARESKAANNTAQIVLFGGIALIFLLAIFGITGD
jgi:CHASE3 domain sensor protein